MRTLDELFIREGAGEERRGQQGEIRCSLGASLKKKKKESEFSLNNRKEKKGVRRVKQSPSRSPLRKKRGHRGGKEGSAEEHRGPGTALQ